MLNFTTKLLSLLHQPQMGGVGAPLNPPAAAPPSQPAVVPQTTLEPPPPYTPAWSQGGDPAWSQSVAAAQAAAESDLARRQEELERKAADLQRREDEMMRNAAAQGQGQ